MVRAIGFEEATSATEAEAGTVMVASRVARVESLAARKAVMASRVAGVVRRECS